MRSVRLLLSMLPLPMIAACGGDEEPGPPPLLVPEGTISISDANRFLPAEPIRSVETAVDVFTTDLGVSAGTTITIQLFDELLFDTTNVARDAALARRLDDFWFPADTSGPTGVGETIIDSGKPVTLVVDLQRRDRQWLVDWEGGVRDEPGNRETSFTFQARESTQGRDYQDHLLEEISGALSAVDATGAPVTRLVIGTELERHYLAAPQDWPYVAAFIGELEAALAVSHPSVQLSVGINWSNFMDAVVPAFYVEGMDADTVDYLAVSNAWKQVIDPLYYAPDAVQDILEGGRTNAAPRLDFLAFSSIPDPARYNGDPAGIRENHYAGIATVFDRESFRNSTSVVWFQVGWPSGTDNAETAGRFLQRFLALNSFPGADNQPAVAAISWWGFNHTLEGECTQLTSPRIGANRTVCFRGLYPTIPQISAQNSLLRTFFGR